MSSLLGYGSTWQAVAAAVAAALPVSEPEHDSAAVLASTHYLVY